MTGTLIAPVATVVFGLEGQGAAPAPSSGSGVTLKLVSQESPTPSAGLTGFSIGSGPNI